jgi:endonuclease-8
MPEGDTVWLTAKRLNEALSGRAVTVFDLRVPQLATADLRGETVSAVLARGKHLLMRFDGGLSLHSHLRMDGSWWINAAGRPQRGCPDFQVRAIVGNESWSAAGCRVHDLALIETVDEANVVGHLGPDLLAADYGPDHEAQAVARIAVHPDAEIAPALLEQRNLAGIGNMYKSEVLFMGRVSPFARVEDVPDLARLVRTARRLLFANRNHPEQSTTGRLAPGQQHWVYLRSGQPCRVCGNAIQVAEQGPTGQQRVTYWCPTCQPNPAQR